MKRIQSGIFVYVQQALSLFRTLEDRQKAKASNEPRAYDVTGRVNNFHFHGEKSHTSRLLQGNTVYVLRTSPMRFARSAHQ